MKVFVAGTFDKFHVGHQYLLWNAYSICDAMVVVVACDKTVERIKNNKPHTGEGDRRKRIVEEFKSHANVDVRLGRKDGRFFLTLEEEKPDLLVLGYDQMADETAIKEAFPGLEIKRMGSYAPVFFKSSKFI